MLVVLLPVVSWCSCHFVCPFVCLLVICRSVCLLVGLSICLPVGLSVGWFVCWFTLLVGLSVHLLPLIFVSGHYMCAHVCFVCVCTRVTMCTGASLKRGEMIQFNSDHNHHYYHYCNQHHLIASSPSLLP